MITNMRKPGGGGGEFFPSVEQADGPELARPGLESASAGGGGELRGECADVDCGAKEEEEGEEGAG